MSDQPSPGTVFTVGHSTLPVDEFIALLRANAIQRLVDVRRFPGSRRHPQFAREALQASLGAAGVDYQWLPELGGRRPPRPDSPNTAWRNAGFRGYADYMQSEGFQLGIAELIELAKEMPSVIMCAERAWQQCHRGLISDWLKAHGWEVLHILSPGRTEPHPYTQAATVVGGELSYERSPPDQGALDLGRN